MPELPQFCNQVGCDKPAAYRFTWPGRAEAGICFTHVLQLVGAAEALGFQLQLIPLFEVGHAETP